MENIGHKQHRYMSHYHRTLRHKYYKKMMKIDENHHTLNFLESFLLIGNNITGAGMMGLPLIFHQAGIIPTCICLIVVGCCAALCGSLLAESISMLPNNKHYDKNISFPSMVRIVIGRKVFILCMVVVVMYCMFQCVTNLIEASKALDTFWTHFISERTYGLVFDDWNMHLESWSAQSCFDPNPNPSPDFESTYTYDRSIPVCLPYGNQGLYVLSTGYLLLALFLLPMGLRTIGQTIPYQKYCFLLLILLICLLTYELLKQHTAHHHIHHPVRLFGSHYGNLLGVVLYNYAYVVTVPTWLHLKDPAVGVNSTIWGAVSFATLMYILFGWLASVSFAYIPTDVLILLSSNRQSTVTKLCAGVYGFAVVAAGVPINCIIMKNSLIAAQICSRPWAVFWGCVFPFLVSWLLYQYRELLGLLKWTGLLLNSFIAFVLPLVIVYQSARVRAICYSAIFRVLGNKIEIENEGAKVANAGSRLHDRGDESTERSGNMPLYGTPTRGVWKKFCEYVDPYALHLYSSETVGWDQGREEVVGNEITPLKYYYTDFSAMHHDNLHNTLSYCNFSSFCKCIRDCMGKFSNQNNSEARTFSNSNMEMSPLIGSGCSSSMHMRINDADIKYNSMQYAYNVLYDNTVVPRTDMDKTTAELVEPEMQHLHGIENHPIIRNIEYSHPYMGSMIIQEYSSKQSKTQCDMSYHSPSPTQRIAAQSSLFMRSIDQDFKLKQEMGLDGGVEGKNSDCDKLLACHSNEIVEVGTRDHSHHSYVRYVYNMEYCNSNHVDALPRSLTPYRYSIVCILIAVFIAIVCLDIIF